MKGINQYINEKFQVGKDNIRKYTYYPKDKDELIECIKDKIKKEGLGTKDKLLDLNDIDTSNIIDMSYLFNANHGDLKRLAHYGNFDISDWDVSNVKDMNHMFQDSSFDGDISNWDVSNVKDMSGMFEWSKFSGRNVDISEWNIRSVENMSSMFKWSSFNGNISNWDVSGVENMEDMFYSGALQFNPPKWYDKYFAIHRQKI